MRSSAGWHIKEGEDAKGRRIVADRPFRPGEVVLQDEAAAWCLIDEHISKYCDCCLALADEPRRCSACRVACYLSRDHQRSAWHAGAHRLECQALRSCAPRVPPTAVRLALRCVLRHWQARQAGCDEDKDPARFGEVMGLLHHWKEMPDGAKVECAQMGAGAHALLAAASPDAAAAVSPRDLAQLLARFGCNSHTITDEELQPLAVGIFPLGAMVNHGCWPNTVHTFRGGRMVFRAVRPIQPGEEVTTAYVDLATPRWERRSALFKHHLFDIDADGGCQGSTLEESASSSSSSSSSRSRAEAQAALRCLTQQRPARVLPLVGGGAGAGELRLYAGELPPWPHDERDSEFTEVRLDGRPRGGMWGALQPAATPGDDAAAAAAASFGFEADVEDGAGAGIAPAPAALEAGGSGAASQQAQQAQQTQQAGQAAAIHCWWHGAPGDPAAAAAVQHLAERYAAALQLLHGLEGQLGGSRAESAAPRLQQALRQLEAGEAAAGGLALGGRHVLRMRLLAELHRAAVAAGQWAAALEAAMQLLPLYEWAYPQTWPQTGLLHAAMAKLAHVLERPAAALAAARAAAAMLAATHGGEGTVVADMQRIAFEAEQELAQGRHGRRQAEEAEADSD